MASSAIDRANLMETMTGPVVPDGRNTVIDEKERHRFIINGTSVLASELNREE